MTLRQRVIEAGDQALLDGKDLGPAFVAAARAALEDVKRRYLELNDDLDRDLEYVLRVMQKEFDLPDPSTNAIVDKLREQIRRAEAAESDLGALRAVVEKILTHPHMEMPTVALELELREVLGEIQGSVELKTHVKGEG